ncbi:DUF1330 domain-containing protein [Geobacter sp. AOG2]|uniref:DUF1330 domain-containing protein n=1 Tax=Geobacter sp. AOG2 TaxID=1566347 RepID=UPI001CC58BB6|nr:DUF1330 domain-containing protein [Geobacter sp. AOG2]GFE59567.1 hypothetical protein AOG2_01550 [Geobacter sp. AOG2]
MPAYVLFIRERVKDRNEIEAYNKLVPPAMAGRDVKLLAVYGKSETLEGPESQGVVLLEFPSYEEAMAWYDSAEYREARAHRFLGADYRVIVTEGA